MVVHRSGISFATPPDVDASRGLIWIGNHIVGPEGSCGKLDQLLNEEYPNRNLLFVIRVPRQYITNLPQHLDQQFNWLAVVYRLHMRQTLPGLFRNPLVSDDQAFAQVSLFVPRPRLVQWQPGLPPPGGLYGGVPGDAGSGGAVGADGEGGLASSRQIWTVALSLARRIGTS